MTEMKIAFKTFTRPLWMAGIVTFQDLMIALRTLDAEPLELDLVRWEHSDLADYTLLLPYIDKHIIAKFPLPPPPPPPLPPRSKIELSDAFTARVRRRAARMLVPPPVIPPPPPPDETMRANGVDCLFSVVMENRADVSVPLLIWIYDLQHHHLPELLSVRERNQRDQVIARESERATRLITQSTSVANDLEQFFPTAQGKARSIVWVSHIPVTVYQAEPTAVLKKYNLPEKFFYLPNQFWMHKNHTLVVEALEMLRARNIHPVVVCTGKPHDDRNADYVGELLSKVSALNLREQFIVLGSVTRDQVYALMRQSVAVLNPSRFEGFGLSVAEAKSLGKRVLVSDLPSLREQDAPHALYFNPNDARELADNMEMLWRTVPAGADLELEANARAALPRRQREFANQFLAVAREAIETFHRAPTQTVP